ncbi:hypothetical protein ABK040_003925 [Willaertia magna]
MNNIHRPSSKKQQHTREEKDDLDSDNHHKNNGNNNNGNHNNINDQQKPTTIVNKSPLLIQRRPSIISPSILNRRNSLQPYSLDPTSSLLIIHDYQVNKNSDLLGYNWYYNIYKGFHIITGEFVVIKHIYNQDILQKFKERMEDFIMKLQYIYPPHEHIAQIYTSVSLPIEDVENNNNLLSTTNTIVPIIVNNNQKEEFYVVVEEFLENGSLFTLVNKGYAINETMIAKYIYQVLEALNFMHERLEIPHLNIKAQNVMLTKNSKIKLSDIGFELSLEEYRKYRPTICYSDPELFHYVKEEYHYDNDLSFRREEVLRKVDVYSVGCLMLELFNKKPPFWDLEWEQLFKLKLNTNNNHLQYIKKYFPKEDCCSELAIDFLQKCFKQPIEQRPLVKDLLKHPWIVSNEEIPSPYVFKPNPFQSVEESKSMIKPIKYIFTIMIDDRRKKIVYEKKEKFFVTLGELEELIIQKCHDLILQILFKDNSNNSNDVSRDISIDYDLLIIEIFDKDCNEYIELDSLDLILESPSVNQIRIRKFEPLQVMEDTTTFSPTKKYSPTKSTTSYDTTITSNSSSLGSSSYFSSPSSEIVPFIDSFNNFKFPAPKQQPSVNISFYSNTKDSFMDSVRSAYSSPQNKQMDLWNNRYLPIRRLNTGGFSSVYECEEITSGYSSSSSSSTGSMNSTQPASPAFVAASPTVARRKVAIKVINIDNTNGSFSFNEAMREALQIMHFSHPHIVKVLDVFQQRMNTFSDTKLSSVDDNNNAYSELKLCIVMPFYNYGDLTHIIKPDSIIPLKILVSVMKQIVSAIKELHSHHVIHRDIKPQNILIEELVKGSNNEIKKIKVLLCDFNLSKSLEEYSRTYSVSGTMPFMAPEIQLNQGYSFKADIWSTGVLLYQLITRDIQTNMFIEMLQKGEKHVHEKILKIINNIYLIDEENNNSKKSLSRFNRLKELLFTTLCFQPENRKTASECLELLNTK